jgi:branched-chain amino acid transport system substrate-binding protein
MLGEASLKFSGRGVPRMARLVAAGGFALTLAACNLTSVPFINDNPPPPASAPVPHVQSQPLGGGGGTVGETVGTGPVRVGAILPLTQNGDPSVIGQSLRNAAQLAVEESGASDITLMIVDDHSTPDGAAQAAQQVVGAGAEIIVGPLFAADVVQAARAAKSADRPMIAFSTDTTVASRGVYLLSFLIESYVDRIVDYAATHGKKSFAVLAPESDYGNVAVSEFQAAAGRLNARVVTIARYPPGQPATGVQQIAEAANNIDALFIPEQAEGMPAVSAALASSGLKAQILGTGVWNDPRVLKLPAVQGAWFAAPENPGFAAFSQRYKAKFNSSPTRLATLSYDAVSLVAALSRTQGPRRFSEAVLTNASGFNGADGVFRFHAEGRNDRGLAVMEINNGDATVVSPAPHSFAGG